MPASPDNNTPEAASKKKRAQLDHALIDVDFFHKPTIKALRRRYKLAGLVAYQEIIFQISRATDAEIDTDTALASAEEFEIIESEEFLTYCLSQNLLNKSPNGKITQVRVAEDQERLAKNRDDYRRRQVKSRDARVTDTEKTRDTTQNKRVSVNTEDLNTEDLKDPKRGVQGGGDCTGAKIPAALNTPEVAQAVGRWRAHLLKNHNRVFDAIAEESLYASYATQRDDLIRNIEWSVQSGWKTIREAPKPDERTRAGPIAPGARNFNATIEAMKNIFAECEHETE